MHFIPSTYQHNQDLSTGLLITNLGTPDAPTPTALRRYLGEFLWDPRITEMPRWLWWLILHGIILRIRPAASAKKYAKVWTDAGSPLLSISQSQIDKLSTRLNAHFSAPLHIALGMRYGKPSIADALAELRAQHVQRLLVLPLYPQYSATTTASTFDAFSKVCQQMRWLPDIRFMSHYHDYPVYIDALAQAVETHINQHGKPDKLLFSYHGIPQRFFLAGDPYHCECHKTSRLVAEKLNLAQDDYQVTFQSHFGREAWLQPYTDHVLQALPKQGAKHVAVMCPGFATDCLETLEEIDQENRARFLAAGGEVFHYLPALNDSEMHIDTLFRIITQNLQGWRACLQTAEEVSAATQQRVALAEQLEKSQTRE